MSEEEAMEAAKALPWANYMACGYRQFGAFEISPDTICDGTTAYRWNKGRSRVIGTSAERMKPRIVEVKR